MKLSGKFVSILLVSALLSGSVSALADVTTPLTITESTTINDNIISSEDDKAAVDVSGDGVVVIINGNVESTAERGGSAIEADGDCTVTVTGNVSNSSKSSTTIAASDGSKVTVNGDVTTGTGKLEPNSSGKGYNRSEGIGILADDEGTEITVNGNVIVPGDGCILVEARYGGTVTVNGNIEMGNGKKNDGIYSEEGTTITVNGNIENEGGEYNSGISTCGGTLTLNGDVNMTGYHATGIDVGDQTNVTVNGDVNMEGFSVAVYDFTAESIVINGDISLKGEMDKDAGFGGCAIWMEHADPECSVQEGILCINGEINVSDAFAFVATEQEIESIDVYVYGVTLGDGAELITSDDVLEEDDEAVKAQVTAELEEALLDNINYIVKYGKGVELVDGYETNEDLGIDYTNKTLGNKVTVKVASGYRLSGDASRVVNLGGGLYSMEALNGEKSFGYLLLEAIRDGLTRGCFVTVNDRQYIVADLDEDAGSITIVSMDIYTDEDLADLSALQAELFTESQQDKVAEIVLPSDEILARCCRYSEKFEHYGTEGRVQMTITSEYMCH